MKSRIENKFLFALTSILSEPTAEGKKRDVNSLEVE